MLSSRNDEIFLKIVARRIFGCLTKFRWAKAILACPVSMNNRQNVAIPMGLYIIVLKLSTNNIIYGYSLARASLF